MTGKFEGEYEFIEENQTFEHYGTSTSGRYPRGSGKKGQKKTTDGGFRMKEVPSEIERGKLGVPQEVKDRDHSDRVYDIGGLMMAKVPTPPKVDLDAIPTKAAERQGRCFELAGQFAMTNPSWDVIHATLYPRAGVFQDKIYYHGFNVKGETIFDPVMGGFFDKTKYLEYFSATDIRQYKSGKAVEMMLKSQNYGPWE